MNKINYEINYEHLTDNMKSGNYPELPAVIFPFKCDTFQLHAINSIEKDNHVLISVPTSSGKTCCAEYAIHYNLKKNKRIIYTTPIKSLSNEKYKEFKEKNICSVGLLTGDNKINPEADLLIVTAEILRNALFTKPETPTTETSETSLLNNISCIIMDEVHFINEPERGKVWEESLILLDDSIQLVLLSATIDRVDDFAKWLQSIKKKQLTLITSNKRIIPLTHSLFVSNELYMISDNTDKFNETVYYNTRKVYINMKKEQTTITSDTTQINNLIKYIVKNDLLQTIFFTFSRNKCEEYANSVQINLIQPIEQNEAINIFDMNIAPYRKIYENLPQFIQMKKLIQKGVAFHHSGLIPILKEIVEIIFKKGLIKILFATETFAVGVNMPTRTVVFTNLSKTTNTGKRFLNTAEYKQMAGRAGRRGLDTAGNVILMTMHEYPDLLDLKSVMIKTMPRIESKFRIDYDYCLKTLNSINTNPTELFNSSLLSNEINKSYNSDLNIYNELLNKLEGTKEFKIEPDILAKCYKIFSKNTVQNNLGFKLSNKEQKEIDKLRKSIPSEILNKYTKIKNIENELKEYSHKLNSNKEYITNETEKIYKILSHNKLIENINLTTHDVKLATHNVKLATHNVKLATNDVKLTTKGIIASHVNDCNGILLSEMILRGIFDELNTVEIIAILSVFTSPPKNNYDEIYISNNLNKEYQKIKSIVLEYENNEKNVGFYLENKEYWFVTNKYIDLVMNWVKTDITDFENLRRTTLQLLYEIEEYEGNFVKNMLKIYNIICNLKNICNIIKKYDLLQKIEKVDELILKDIVNVNSLYLN
jgi:superfamily II RNA helicase